MKQIVVLCIAVFIAFAATAQKNVTKFLGIPVDGTKQEMIQKLKAKGFVYNSVKDELSGQFNDKEVHVYVITNRNKVCRIAVVDVVTSSESSIKIAFNRLCHQFSESNKYLPAAKDGNYVISEDEDISYQMSVNSKRYEAAYYQVSDLDEDTTGFSKWMRKEIIRQKAEEEVRQLSDNELEIFKAIMLKTYNLEKYSNRSVWFMIDEKYGEYRILLYYDNELNRSNGDDL